MRSKYRYPQSDFNFENFSNDFANCILLISFVCFVCFFHLLSLFRKNIPENENIPPR